MGTATGWRIYDSEEPHHSVASIVSSETTMQSNVSQRDGLFQPHVSLAKGCVYQVKVIALGDVLALHQMDYFIVICSHCSFPTERLVTRVSLLTMASAMCTITQYPRDRLTMTNQHGQECVPRSFNKPKHTGLKTFSLLLKNMYVLWQCQVKKLNR